jgi:hypothetical protein
VGVVPVRLVAVGLVFCAGGALRGQARPQSRPRYLCAYSETKARRCCPHLNPLGRGGPESFARLALTRVPLVAALGLELGILGEKPQALERAGAISKRISMRHPTIFGTIFANHKQDFASRSPPQ